MLTQAELLAFTNQLFPQNHGVLLTGSQRNNSILKKEGDIDVLVLDTLSSHTWSVIRNKEGYAIEFIIMPVSDLDNILDHGIYEPKNGLLHLVQGNILSDPYCIMEPLLKKANGYFNSIQYKTEQEYHKYLTELMKLRKLFLQPLSPPEKSIMLCDFVSIISLLETIRVSNWSSKTKHKLRNLKEKSPEFLEKIESLFQKGVQGNYAAIIDYINFYEKNYTINYLPQDKKYEAFIVNLSYDDFTLSHFVLHVLPSILEDEQPGKAYQYFYLSPRKYHHKYKQDVSLVFRITTEAEGLALLEKVQHKLEAMPNAIRFDYFCAHPNVPVIGEACEVLKVELSKWIATTIQQDNDFDKNKVAQLFFQLSLYVKQQLEISNQDYIRINSFIGQRWLFTREEQLAAPNYPSLVYLLDLRLKKANEPYKDYLPFLMQYLIKERIDDPDVEKIIQPINEILDQKEGIVLPADDINIQLLKSSHYTDYKSIWLYKTIVEEILLVSNIADFQKYTCLYSCSKAITETVLQ